ncbi:MAG: glycogen/starch synthase, partial [Bacteroidales bacterium]|nr:glycogen/starch synthase [Bacteroidales bacterium]
MKKVKPDPDFIFEVSWEVCNKVGGIHTVISTKAQSLKQTLKDNIIYIGPDFNYKEHREKEFKEDDTLYPEFKQKAIKRGIPIRIGRWKIPGEPQVILIDFKPLLKNKDAFYAKMWEVYRLESLYGADDYHEPAIFGYAAGQIIECFVKDHVSVREKVVAQFHEWMTGAGCLYIEHHMPEIATIFTTHATMLGRVLASNGEALYDNLYKFDTKEKTNQYNVSAKCSLEKKAALAADCLTTVSEITARECKQFYDRAVDVVLPNGFEDDFVPEAGTLKSTKESSRKQLKVVAETMLGYSLPPDTLFVGTGGRYEFKNKGIDVLLDTLGQINHDRAMEREIVAFFFIPGDQRGPRKDLVNSLAKNKKDEALVTPFITHYLGNVDHDPILNKIKQVGFTNDAGEKVKVIFAPTYLTGHDGIFNKAYYDLLMGLDLSIFPSYYEPWGYTPMESVAFGVPTITTSLAGFGKWVMQIAQNGKGGVEVIDRNDSNTSELVHNMAHYIQRFAQQPDEVIEKYRENAREIAQRALWKNFIGYYHKAYELAIRNNMSKGKDKHEIKQLQVARTNELQWRKLVVESNLPADLS